MKITLLLNGLVLSFVISMCVNVQEDMDSKAMWREIQRLRERENTLLYAMQQMMVDKQAMAS